jgi:hypothetical protein
MNWPSATRREWLCTGWPKTQALGRLTSSPRPVCSRVANMPTPATVPSVLPMRTYSPLRSTRAYIRLMPAMTWPTTLDAPSDSISPASTLTPLKASLPDPGRKG